MDKNAEGIFMKKASPFIHGTLVLTAANLFSRFIGFYNRIFLAGLIGAHQMGIYQMIFPIYLVGFSLCFQGFQTALSNMTASLRAKGLEGDAKKILSVTVCFTVMLSIVFAAVIFIFAEAICQTFFHEDDCIPCLRIAVFALPFVGIKSCIHGYSLGAGTSSLPALSLCIEQISRVASIFLISVTFYAELPAGAILAVLGMVIGEFVSFVFTILSFYFRQKDSVSSIYTRQSLFHQLLSLGMPLTGNALSVTLLQSVESILIPLMLTRFYGNQHTAIETYGILNGMALPFILFPSTMTNSLSVMLLPKISAAKADGSEKTLRRASRYPVIFCLLLGLLGFFGFFTLGPWIGRLVFQSGECGTYLRLLSFLCPFLYISGTLSSILNGLGETKTTFLHNGLSLTLRIFFILFAVPRQGIYGYLFGLTAGSILQVLLNFRHLKQVL